MKVINDRNRRQGKRVLALALLTAVVLAGAFIASGDRPPSGDWFQHLESGINHCSTPFDSHHICATGMNSLLGHCTTTITLSKANANSGLIEYRSNKNGDDTVYGILSLKATSAPQRTLLSIRFVGGTGRYEGVTGKASGMMERACGGMDVEAYSANVRGFLVSTLSE